MRALTFSLAIASLFFATSTVGAQDLAPSGAAPASSSFQLEDPTTRHRFRRRAAGGALLGAGIGGGLAAGLIIPILNGSGSRPGAIVGVTLLTFSFVTFGGAVGTLLARTVAPFEFKRAIASTAIALAASSVVGLVTFLAILGIDGADKSAPATFVSTVFFGTLGGAALFAGLASFLALRWASRDSSAQIAIGPGSITMRATF